MKRRKGQKSVRPISQADAYDREEREREEQEPDTRPNTFEERERAEIAAVPALWKGHFHG